MAKPQDTDTYCWKPSEVSAIITLCSQHPELKWLDDVLITLACTGLRISELASLRWSDVDFNKNMIVLVDESMRAPRQTARRARELKTGRSRAFPIHQDLRNVLLQMVQHKDGYIFHGPRGGALKPDTARRILVRDVLSKLANRFPTSDGEIGLTDGRLHSFRHFFCSTCANAGVPEQVLMNWLGHRSSRMVRRYYHLHDEETQRQMHRLEFLCQAGRQCDAG